jgi:hypothetical protein
MLGHEPLPRHHIERLGDILPDLRELAAAAARARSGRGVDDAPATNAVAIVPLFPPRSKRAEIFPERPPLDSAFDSQIEIRQ